MDKRAQIIREGGHYFFSVDGKSKDFVAYNVDAYKLTEEEVLPEDLIPLKYKEVTPIIQKLKSEAWSCGCQWFFILQDEGIYLMNVYKESFWLCKKHSHKFIDMYLNPKKPV